MATSQTTAFDRFNDALKQLDDQFQELREQLDERRKEFEKDVRKGADKVQKQLKDTGIYKRAEQARGEWEEQVDKARSSVYELFGVATKSDVEKLSRKLNTLSRKLSELSKEGKSEPSREALDI
jgi:uncharacterized coiled-coil protein SlyX